MVQANKLPALTRRNLIKVLGLGALSTAAGTSLTACGNRPLINTLNVAGGEEGGMYFEFAKLLSEALLRHSIAANSMALATEASVQNLQMLTSGEAGLSLALADTVADQSGGNRQSLRALGRVYQNYFHCIVRRDSSILNLEDLAGKRLGTGAPGSGTWVTGQRILTAAKLTTAAHSPKQAQLGYVKGLKALESGSIDALFLFGGIPVSSISELSKKVDLRLLDLGEVLPALRSEHPKLYDHVIIPRNTYPTVAEVSTVGVGNLLMANSNLPDAVAEAIVRLLVNHAAELIPVDSTGIQYLTAESLISTAGQPLHPAASQAYKELHG